MTSARTPAAGSAALAPFPPELLVLGSVLSIQFGAGFAARVFDDVGPAGISMLRLGFAAVIMLVLLRPRVRGRPRADLGLAAVFGITLGTMNLAFYEALDRIPLGIAVTIEFAGPLAVALFGARRRADVGWALLAGLGILLLVRPGSGDLDTTGLALISLAGLCWAGYILLNARSGRRFEGASGLAIAMPVAALVPLVPGILEAGGGLGTRTVLLTGVAVAVMSSVIPYSLETEALRRLPENVFGVLMSLGPAVAALAGFVVLGQSLSARQLAAILLVVVASVGITRAADGAPVPRDA